MSICVYWDIKHVPFSASQRPWEMRDFIYFEAHLHCYASYWNSLFLRKLASEFLVFVCDCASGIVDLSSLDFSLAWFITFHKWMHYWVPLKCIFAYPSINRWTDGFSISHSLTKKSEVTTYCICMPWNPSQEGIYGVSNQNPITSFQWPRIFNRSTPFSRVSFRCSGAFHSVVFSGWAYAWFELQVRTFPQARNGRSPRHPRTRHKLHRFTGCIFGIARCCSFKFELEPSNFICEGFFSCKFWEACFHPKTGPKKNPKKATHSGVF